MAMSYAAPRAILEPVSRDATRAPATGRLPGWRVRLAKQLIRTHLSQGISVDALASACGLSRSHFARAFKASTGYSPQDWLRRERVALAKTLICTTELTLTQIAVECGFFDQAHFSRFFSRIVGTNPLAWRRSVSRLAPMMVATDEWVQVVSGAAVRLGVLPPLPGLWRGSRL